ncbi:hypothetical protein Tco_1004890 [Tanacetum coccineum]|uniref:Uncharacterized protein n=1 Tax=Tanacetum coccineum TaxID=301880 RepID=A0ABQ5FFN1_9ASTR
MDVSSFKIPLTLLKECSTCGRKEGKPPQGGKGTRRGEGRERGGKEGPPPAETRPGEGGGGEREERKAYEDEKYAAACRYMLSVSCDDEDDYIPLAITPDLPIEEPDNFSIMGDEHSTSFGNGNRTK